MANCNCICMKLTSSAMGDEATCRADESWGRDYIGIKGNGPDEMGRFDE